uniref:Uncharacterized protein n=1 Tax=Amphimedon queenslandica TaxID=400682 RepID=A0A1X7URQ8_AMPQE
MAPVEIPTVLRNSLITSRAAIIHVGPKTSTRAVFKAEASFVALGDFFSIFIQNVIANEG